MSARKYNLRNRETMSYLVSVGLNKEEVAALDKFANENQRPWYYRITKKLSRAAAARELIRKGLGWSPVSRSQSGRRIEGEFDEDHDAG